MAHDGRNSNENNVFTQQNSNKIADIFEELAGMPRWVPHTSKKVPHNGERGLSTRKPQDWMPQADALKRAAAWRDLVGVGLVLTGGVTIDGHRLLVLDFDGITDAFVPPFQTFSERSPSGKGIHSYVWIPEAEAAQLRDSLGMPYPGCAHLDLFLGSSPRFITVPSLTTPDSILDGSTIAMLEGEKLASALALLKPAESGHNTTPPVIEEGTPVDLTRIKLSADEHHLLEVVGKDSLDRSPVVHGLLIKLFDKAQATPADALATMLHTPSLWTYCLFHRQDDPERATAFAREEVQRAWDKSLTGKRERLTGFNESWKTEPLPKQAMVTFPPPFPGVMADAVAAALAVAFKLQPELAMLAALIAMASACPGHFELPNGCRLNLYGCGISDTGTGKEATREFAVTLASEAQVKVTGKAASGQAYEDMLKPYEGMLIEIDELGHLFEAINSSRAPSYLIEMAAMFLKLFSDSKSAHHPRGKAGCKESPPAIPHPTVSIIGFSTQEKLGQAVTTQNIEEGMLGRFLFVPGQENPKPRVIRESLALPESVKLAARSVRQAHSYAPLAFLLNGATPGKIGITPEADRLFNELIGQFHEQGCKTSSPFARALYSRSYEKVERIAGVLAVFDQPNAPVIGVDHVMWAMKFVSASDAALLKFAGEFLHGGQEQEDAAKLRRLIERALKKEFTTQKPGETAAIKTGWVAHTMLLRISKLDSKKRFHPAIDYLVEVGELEIHRGSEELPPAYRLTNSNE